MKHRFSALCMARWAIAPAASVLAHPVLGAGTAWADTPVPSPPPNSSQESAPALAMQGVKLFRAHAYEPACEALARAYALDPRSETLLELGLAEVEAGHPVAASKHLHAYLARSDASPTKSDAVRTRWWPRIEAETAHLAVFAPAGAAVRIDGVLAEPDPVAAEDHDSSSSVLPPTAVLVATGEHDVTVQTGALVQSQHVVANVGEQVEIHFSPVPEAPSPPPPALPWTAPVVLEPPPTPSSRARWIALLGFESAAVVATGVAIGFSIAVENSASDADTLIKRVRAETGGESGCLAPTLAAQCPQIGRDRQEERNDAPLATGFYIAAGALAGIGAATFLGWPSPKETAGDTGRLVPWIGDRTAGAAWKGTW